MVQFESGATELHAHPLQEAPQGTQLFDSSSWQTYQALLEGLNKLKVSKADQLGKAPANKKLGEADAAQEDLLEKAGASKRQLVPRDSDVTMGSEDIPDIFKTPASKKAKAASGLEKPSPSSSKLVSQQRPAGCMQPWAMTWKSQGRRPSPRPSLCSKGLHALEKAL